MNLLLYPQAVLILWWPLLVWALERATRQWRQGLSPRSGFAVSLGLLLLPVLAWWVPYLPQLPLREWLPYRAPIAWGVYNGAASSRLEWLLLTVPAMLVFGGMVGAALYGATEELAARWRVSRLPGQREGRVTVLNIPGQAAFTLGRQVFISREVWEGPHCAAVLAHEQAHASAGHGLWLALARHARRSLWFWPPAAGLLREVETWAELVADAHAAQVAGKPALARALRDVLPPSSPARPALSFASTSLTQRVQKLLRPGRELTFGDWLALTLLFVALLILV